MSELLDDVNELLEENFGDLRKLDLIKYQLESDMDLIKEDEEYVEGQIIKLPDSRSPDNKLPKIFNKTFIGFWVAGFMGVFALVLWGLSEINTPTYIKEFLYANTAILVTIFTVTMGFTLLGLQFKAQLYSMLDLISYLKNKVVYGFILTLVVSIIFNIIASIFFSILDPNLVISFAIVGTIISLTYFIGYVYYTTYEIQPSQVLQRMHRGMKKELIDYTNIVDKSDANFTSDYDHVSDKFEQCAVWEQIMLKAIEDDNKYIFERGIRIMFHLWNKNKNQSNDKKNNIVINIFSNLIKTTMLSCVEQDRDRFAKIFLDRYKNTLKSYLGSTGTFSFDDEPSDLWHRIIYRAIEKNNRYVFNHCVDMMFELRSYYLDRCDDKEKNTIIQYFFLHISLPMMECVTRNRKKFVDAHMDNFVDMLEHTISNSDDFPKISVIDIWKDIMIWAAKSNNKDILEQGIKMIFRLNKSLEMCSADVQNKILNLFSVNGCHVMTSCVKHNNDEMTKMFIDDFEEMFMQFLDKQNDFLIKEMLFEIWESIIKATVDMNNKDIFDQNMEMIFDVWKKYIEKYSKQENDNVTMIFHQYINSAVQSCINANNHMFVDMASRKLVAKFNFSMNIEYVGSILGTLENITHWSIGMNQRDIFIFCINAILDLQNKHLQHGTDEEKDRTVEFFSMCIEFIVGSCLKTDHKDLTNKLIIQLNEKSMIFLLDSKYLSFKKSVFTIWERIMHWSIENNDNNIFKNGMMLISKLQNRRTKKYISTSENSIEDFAYDPTTRVIRTCFEQNRDNLIDSFMILFSNTLKDIFESNWDIKNSGISGLLIQTMIWAIETNNQNIFNKCMSMIITAHAEYLKENLIDEEHLNQKFSLIVMWMVKHCVDNNRESFISKHTFHFKPVLLESLETFPLPDIKMIFSKWKHVMLYAIKTNQLGIFDYGMEMMSLIHKHLYNSEYERRDEIIQGFTLYVTSIVQYCIRNNEQQFIEIFTARFKNALQQHLSSSDDHFYIKMLLDIWEQIMTTTMLHENSRTLADGLRMVENIVKKHLENEPDNGKNILALFHNPVMNLAKLSISHNQDRYFESYFKYMRNYEFIHYLDSSIEDMIGTWEMMMSHTVFNERADIFRFGMESIFGILSNLSTKPEDKDRAKKSVKICHVAITRIIKNIKDERYIVEFFKHVSTMNVKMIPIGRIPVHAWKHATLEAMHEKNTVIFDIAINSVRILVKSKDMEFFKNFSKIVSQHADRSDTFTNKELDEVLGHIDAIVVAMSK